MGDAFQMNQAARQIGGTICRTLLAHVVNDVFHFRIADANWRNGATAQAIRHGIKPALAVC